MESRLLGTLLKAGRVLDLFTPEHPEWGVTEIADELDLPKSSVHALLTSLVAIRLMTRTDDGRFRLGWRMLEFGDTVLSSSEVFAATRQVMLELGDQLKQSVYLAILDGRHVLFASRLQGATALPAVLAEVGATLPPHASAAGKVLLAHESDDRINEVLDTFGLPRLTERTVTRREDLKADLAATRTRGFAISREEAARGLCCVAAPVLDANGRVIASLGVSVSPALFEFNQRQLIASVAGAARRASRENGWRPPTSARN